MLLMLLYATGNNIHNCLDYSLTSTCNIRPQKVWNVAYIHCHFLGNDLLDKALLDEECLNMDLVYDAIDLYRHAAVKTRDIEVYYLYIY